MQFGIKSLLGVMVLLAAFVMGVFQFEADVCVWTLALAHLLSPALWVTCFYGNLSRALKVFFLGGLSTGITPWIFTLWLLITTNVRNLAASYTVEDRVKLLAWWSSSGIIAIIGGLLACWVYRCCAPQFVGIINTTTDEEHTTSAQFAEKSKLDD